MGGILAGLADLEPNQLLAELGVARRLNWGLIEFEAEKQVETEAHIQVAQVVLHMETVFHLKIALRMNVVFRLKTGVHMWIVLVEHKQVETELLIRLELEIRIQVGAESRM